ncbi:MAG TPA: hypothetical protein PK318_07290 [Accumulibacter sp.]|nr:hypothetical protein [Accumulibacter sp.]HNE13165.1 hypothetical protein [Accumulibacter sp.]
MRYSPGGYRSKSFFTASGLGVVIENLSGNSQTDEFGCGSCCFDMANGSEINYARLSRI